ncbi:MULTISPECIES: hypothetical protein [Helicobacter]|nr:MULTISPECIES: hypothetical protein [Helicobacter]
MLNITLTDKDRKELAPLLGTSAAERALMPEETLKKLKALEKEQQDGPFEDLDKMINESISAVKTKKIQKKLVLTDKDREELAPLLNISQAERKLMPKETLKKLEIFEQEQENPNFKDLEDIIKESMSLVEAFVPNTLYKELTRRSKKDYLWWETNYRIFLAQRKAQRARHRAKMDKKQK